MSARVSHGNVWPEPTVGEPDESELEEMAMGEYDAEATDGCTVEPDGVCPHGHPSWLVWYGEI